MASNNVDPARVNPSIARRATIREKSVENKDGVTILPINQAEAIVLQKLAICEREVGDKTIFLTINKYYHK